MRCRSSSVTSCLEIRACRRSSSWWGRSGAEKGTIGRVLTGLIGAHNTAAPTLAGISTNFGLSPLIGKPLALIADARLSSKADSKIVVERLLSISGEDTLTIDRKYREPWTGRLPSRFVVLTNELPRLSDSSGALASRFVVFVLTQSFYGRENPKLTEVLLSEAPGIFNWALAGLDRLNKRGYFQVPTSGQDAVQQLEDLSSPISAFLRDRCVVDGQASIGVDALWTLWKTWCTDDNRPSGDESGLRPGSPSSGADAEAGASPGWTTAEIMSTSVSAVDHTLPRT